MFVCFLTFFSMQEQIRKFMDRVTVNSGDLNVFLFSVRINDGLMQPVKLPELRLVSNISVDTA